MPDPSDYGEEWYDMVFRDDEEDETVWDAASDCLGMVGLYLLISCLIVLVIVFTVQLFR